MTTNIDPTINRTENAAAGVPCLSPSTFGRTRKAARSSHRHRSPLLRIGIGIAAATLSIASNSVTSGTANAATISALKPGPLLRPPIIIRQYASGCACYLTTVPTMLSDFVRATHTWSAVYANPNLWPSEGTTFDRVEVVTFGAMTANGENYYQCSACTLRVPLSAAYYGDTNVYIRITDRGQTADFTAYIYYTEPQPQPSTTTTIVF